MVNHNDSRIAFLKEIKSRFGDGIEKMQRVDGGKSYIIKFKTNSDEHRVYDALIDEELYKKYNITLWAISTRSIEIF